MLPPDIKSSGSLPNLFKTKAYRFSLNLLIGSSKIVNIDACQLIFVLLFIEGPVED